MRLFSGCKNVFFSFLPERSFLLKVQRLSVDLSFSLQFSPDASEEFRWPSSSTRQVEEEQRRKDTFLLRLIVWKTSSSYARCLVCSALPLCKDSDHPERENVRLSFLLSFSSSSSRPSLQSASLPYTRDTACKELRRTTDG